MQPLTIYGDLVSPNPCKVRIVLDELAIPYVNELLAFTDLKKEPYVSINPNGRVPAIHDSNTGITLWESAAILSYLVETYDKEHKLTYISFPEKHLINQWVAYQISGQGPYYGQMIWFNLLHIEKVPTAVERYEKEIERVRSVLNSHLTKTEGMWLVGDKCTIADLSWVMWEHIADFALSFRGINLIGKYPAYDAWAQRMYARPAVRKAIAERKEGLIKSGLMEMVRARAREDGFDIPSEHL